MVTRLRLRNFRSYERRRCGWAPGITVVAGRNGAGKTNLLEALYFACTGRSCRTSNERECVRFGARRRCGWSSRSRTTDGAHTSSRRLPARARPSASRSTARRSSGCATRRSRPLVVRLPARPARAGRRARRRCAARTSTRSSPRCGRRARRRAAPTPPALAQRNALARPRSAPAAPAAASLPAWDAELARHGIALMADRAAAVERLRPRFAEHAAGLGLEGDAASCATGRARRRPTPEELAAELAERLGRRPRARLHRPRPAPRRPRASRATAASCAPTARGASSGSRCWRCCSPSARRWPTTAGRRR